MLAVSIGPAGLNYKSLLTLKYPIKTCDLSQCTNSDFVISMTGFCVIFFAYWPLGLLDYNI